MKKIATIFCIVITSVIINAQNNITINGSFENTSKKPCSTGQYSLADSITSANNTSVDLYSVNPTSSDKHEPQNLYMGKQWAATGKNYAGIVTYYADEAGIITTVPGYQRYTEYVQVPLSEPMVAGRSYEVGFSVSLARNSAFAHSGLGMHFSKEKIDEDNNSFLNVAPHLVSFETINSNTWVTIYGNYIARGGEQYVTIGAFPEFMLAEKIIPDYVNNSRKAYYYIDDVYVYSTNTIIDTTYASVLTGACFKMGSVNFETDKSVILSDSYQELNELADFLKKYSYLTIYVDGYPDKTDTDKKNKQLAKDRAEAVKKYLTSKGLADSRIITRGYENNNPVADIANGNSEINRRVEIIACTDIE